MNHLRITNLDTGIVVGKEIEEAATFPARLRGLMFRKSASDGMLLRDVNSIHMLFMRFPIDAIFIDADGKIVKIVENVAPWFGTALARARDVLEVASGHARRTDCRVGHQLLIDRKET